VGLSQSDLESMGRQFSRNALDSSEYPTSVFDIALQMAGDEWCSTVREPRVTIDLAMTPGTATLTGLPGDFLPEQALSVFLSLDGKIVSPKVDFISRENLLDLQYQTEGQFGCFVSQSTPAAGRPSAVCLEDNATILLDRVPDQAYTLHVRRWQYFNLASPNLPDDRLRLIARFGCPGYLQLTEKKNQEFAQDCLDRLAAHMKRYAARNAGGLGGAMSVRSPIRRGGR